MAEPRRALARDAASNLSDFATCEAEDLEDCLQIPGRRPRAAACRRGGNSKDEAPAPATVAVATVATHGGWAAPAAAVPWRTTLNQGRQLTRTETGTSDGLVRAAVVGWQPADESDFDARGRPKNPNWEPTAKKLNRGAGARALAKDAHHGPLPPKAPTPSSRSPRRRKTLTPHRGDAPRRRHGMANIAKATPERHQQKSKLVRNDGPMLRSAACERGH